MSQALSEDHEIQVQGYLRFAKFKRDQHLREVKAIVRDFSEYRVRENEVYTTKEVQSLISELEEELMQKVEIEFENSSFSSGLLLRLLFEQAEMADLIFAADTNELENEYLLKQIAASAEEALKKPASAFARKPQRLGKLGAETVSDARVIRERDDLRQQVKDLRQQVAEANAQASSSREVGGEAEALRQKLAETEKRLQAEREKNAQLQRAESANTASDGLAKEMEQLKMEYTLEAEAKDKEHAEATAELKKRNKKLKADMEATKEELRLAKLEASRAGEAAGQADMRMSESKQFQQMRKIMAQKSEEVTSLRRRLAKYEPESVADGDL